MKVWPTVPALLADPPPHIEWVLPGFIPGDPAAFVLVAAGAKLGKTTLVTQMAEAITLGQPFLDGGPTSGANVPDQPWVPPAPASAFYVQADCSEGEWYEHCRQVCPTAKFASVVAPRNLMASWNVVAWAKVKQTIQQLQPRVVIWDALESIVDPGSMDVNTLEGVHKALKALREASKTTHVILHHTNKSSDKTWKDKISGHHVLQGQAAVIVGLQGKPGHATLRVTGRYGLSERDYLLGAEGPKSKRWALREGEGAEVWTDPA